MDYLNVCRLCSKSENTLLYVFGDIETNLSDKIYLCFGVQINLSDPISTKICRSCYYFTNSAYEHRISSQENDSKLKEQYEKLNKPVRKILYPTDISQTDFFNNFKLITKDEADRIRNTPLSLHPSVLSLKRKYPKITIPYSFRYIDINPYVDVNAPPKKIKRNSNIWSVSKKNTKKPMDLILTRVNTENTDKEQSKILLNKKRKSSKRNKSLKKKPKLTKDPEPVVEKELDTVKEIVKKLDEPGPSSQDDRSVLKTLLKSDELITQSLSKLTNTANLNDSYQTLEEKNLLLSVGQEVKTYICQTCNKVFDSPELLKFHKRSNHKTSLRCLYCPKKFTIVESLIKHQNTYHKSKMKIDLAKVLKEMNKKQTQNVSEPKNDVPGPSNDIPAPKNDESESSKDAPDLNDNNSTNSNDNDNIPSPDVDVPSPENDVPETNDIISTKEIDNLTKNSTPLMPRKTVARKRTNGALFITKPSDVEMYSHDVTELVISSDSSDDDCEITDIISNKSILKSALSDNKPPTILESVLKSPTFMKSETKNDVFLIDSDSEEAKKTFLEQHKTGSNKSQQLSVRLNQITIPEKSEKIKTSPSPSSSSSEDKVIVDAPMSGNAKITNELSYINYLFKKCSYDDKNPNTDSHKWNLKNIKQLAKKVAIPIEVQKISNETTFAQYITALPRPKPFNVRTFWDAKNAIDAPPPFVPKKAIRIVPAKSLKPFPTVKAIPEPVPEVKAPKIPISRINVTPRAVASISPQRKVTTNVTNTTQTIVKTSVSNQTQNVVPPLQVGNKTIYQKHLNFNITNKPIPTSNNINEMPPLTSISSPLPPPLTSISVHKQINTIVDATDQLSVLNSVAAAAATTGAQPIVYAQLYQPTNSIMPQIQPTITTTTTTTSVDNTLQLQQQQQQQQELQNQQPLVLNGIPYIAKTVNNVANKNATIVLQQVDQQGNYNIQNYINITQPSFYTTDGQLANIPFYIPTNNTIQQQLPQQQQQQVVEPATTTIAETPVTTERPMLRIKSLAELQDNNKSSSDTSTSKEGNITYTNAFSSFVTQQIQQPVITYPNI